MGTGEHSRRVILRIAGGIAAGLATPGLAWGADEANPSEEDQSESDGATAAPQPQPYPAVGPGTAFLDHRTLLGDLPEPGWFEANIPFVDLPDETIQGVYYYRWRVFYEALRYTRPEEGWIVTEFLSHVDYAAPGGAIVAAAGHHLTEGRWLRDRRYLDDYLLYWLRGSGISFKAPLEDSNPHATDWAHQYSFWCATAAYQRALVTGDWDFLAPLLPELVRQWERWARQYDSQLGLYWQVPVWDGMEYSASSYASGDPFHGGAGFRPTINSYQCADARAIAALARRTGDHRLADTFDRRANDLLANQQRWLWESGAGFYKHVMRDGNPARAKLPDREEFGFVPWALSVAPPEHAVAWRHLLDPEGFAAEFGPTTVERRSHWFMHQAAEGCCRWDGPSWPYATSQTLTGLANLLIDYPAQPYVGADEYYRLLEGYARTQYKDGHPYVAEAHHPDRPVWIYDTPGHSEDYNHSTFNDLVLSGLLGIRPQADDTVRISPLVPESWHHFAVENLPYHGHNLTLMWDRDGSRYGMGTGLSVYVDGAMVHRQETLSPALVRVGPVRAVSLPHVVDVAANQQPTAGFPVVKASYEAPGHEAVQAIDGQKHFLDRPSTRWTTEGSPNPQDWLAVDFGQPTEFGDVRVFFHSDGGRVLPPAWFQLQHRVNGQWVEIPGQRRVPDLPVAQDLNRITFPPVPIRELRLLVTRHGNAAVGVAALQCWAVR